MEQLDLSHGVPTLLASIVVLLCLNILFKVGELLWEVISRRGEVSEKSIEKLTAALTIATSAVQRLESRLNEVEKNLSEIPQFKSDLKRLFHLVRHLAGSQWKDLKQQVFEEEIE